MLDSSFAFNFQSIQFLRLAVPSSAAMIGVSSPFMLVILSTVLLRYWSFPHPILLFKINLFHLLLLAEFQMGFVAIHVQENIISSGSTAGIGGNGTAESVYHNVLSDLTWSY